MSERFPDLQEAAAKLVGADEVVLTCHVGPDGDALGSMLAVAVAAVAAGKKALPSFGPPFVLPPTYRFLPTHLLVPPEAIPPHPELMLSFDAAGLDRLAGMAGPAIGAACLIVLDHHVAGSGGFGHLNLIDTNAAATAEIAHALITAAGWPVDQVVAQCLLTGLVTDTGRFQYSNTRPETLRLAADLVAAGASPDLIGRHIYEESPFRYLSVAARVLGRAQLEIRAGLVWSALFQSDLTEIGIEMTDTDPLIDLVRLPVEAKVALLLKEQAEGGFKASMRSRGEVDVGRIAASHGGGGHHNAAGFSHAGPVDEIVAAVVAQLGT